MKNPFIQSLRQALGEVIDFEAIQKCIEQYEQQFKQKLEEDGTPETFE